MFFHAIIMVVINMKEEMYSLLYQQIKALCDEEKNLIANLSNISALLNETLEDINWVGFYLENQNELILGPFQGKVACVHIPNGKGVCGTCMQTKQIQRVADVHAFPTHIACDGASNSEIVLPLISNGCFYGVLDIDSPKFDRFDEADEAGLKKVCALISTYF